MQIKTIIHILKNIALIKTLYLNFKVFPVGKAIRVPILVGRNVRLINIGRIKVNYTLGKRISIGAIQLFNTASSIPTIWNNKGIISFNGDVKIYPGATIYTDTNGKIEFGGNNRIGSHTSILSKDCVFLGTNTEISWNSQIADSDFHFVKNIETGKVRKRTAPISIGDNVWIGNHVSIAKGVTIADGCICGQNSFINKSCTEPNTILVGCPAVQKNSGYTRIFDLEEEKKLAMEHDYIK